MGSAATVIELQTRAAPTMCVARVPILNLEGVAGDIRIQEFLPEQANGCRARAVVEPALASREVRLAVFLQPAQLFVGRSLTSKETSLADGGRQGGCSLSPIEECGTCNSGGGAHAAQLERMKTGYLID